MNISIEAQVLNHPRRSGLMTYTEGLVNGLRRHDSENDYSLLYYSLRRSPDLMPGPDGDNFRKVVLKVPDREFFARQTFIDRVALPNYFRDNKVEIFHRVNGYTMPAVRDIFKILTVHDLRTLTIGDSQWAQNIDHYMKALRLADICVVVSQCTKKDLIQHFNLDEKKIKVVYLGADERYKPALKEQVNEIRSRFQIHLPYFLSVGSVPRKNIEGVIRGFAGFRYRSDYQLVLNCKNDIEKYTRLGEELHIKDQIVFVNNVSDDDLIALYSGCHCFVFPSLYEGFGLPILEAMNCGAPVITSNTSACPEVAGDAAILVDPRNIEEISDAMDQVCQNAHLRQSLVNKGFERARLFSWDKFAMRMKEVYVGI